MRKSKGYIAIVHYPQGYTHFSASYLRDFRKFRRIIKAHHGKVLAERSNISDGLSTEALKFECDEDGNIVYEGDLPNLLKRLNSGEKLDIPREFKRIMAREYRC